MESLFPVRAGGCLFVARGNGSSILLISLSCDFHAACSRMTASPPRRSSGVTVPANSVFLLHHDHGRYVYTSQTGGLFVIAPQVVGAQTETTGFTSALHRYRYGDCEGISHAACTSLTQRSGWTCSCGSERPTRWVTRGECQSSLSGSLFFFTRKDKDPVDQTRAEYYRLAGLLILKGQRLWVERSSRTDALNVSPGCRSL
jgi:hypothetical protein